MCTARHLFPALLMDEIAPQLNFCLVNSDETLPFWTSPYLIFTLVNMGIGDSHQ